MEIRLRFQRWFIACTYTQIEILDVHIAEVETGNRLKDEESSQIKGRDKAMGGKLKFVLQVFDKDGKIVHQDTFDSYYMCKQASYIWKFRGYDVNIQKVEFGGR